MFFSNHCKSTSFSLNSLVSFWFILLVLLFLFVSFAFQALLRALADRANTRTNGSAPTLMSKGAFDGEMGEITLPVAGSA